MKNIIRLLTLFLFSSILFSCKKKDLAELKLIPKDASMVMIIDNEQLKAKLDKANIDTDSIFNKIFSYDSSNSKDVKEKFTALRNNAGIDWNKKVILFIEPKSFGAKGNGTTINLIAHVKDSSKFLAYLLKQDEIRGRDVVNDKSYSYISLDYKGMVSWTDKLAMLTFFNYEETFNNDKPFANVNEQEGINKTEEIKKEVSRFYSLKDEESVASLSILSDLLKKKADISTLQSTTSLKAMLTHIPLSLPKLPELLQDNYTTSTFNFDEGKITTSSAFYPNKTIAAILKTYPGSSVNLPMLENYPSNDIDLAFLANFNPQVIDALLKELEVEPLGDAFLNKIGLKTSDLYKVFKGDISFTLSDFSWKSNNDSALLKNKPALKYLFNATVGDTAVLHKLLNKAVELGFIIKQNNSYKLKESINFLGVYVNITDKNIIIASDEGVYQKYMAQTSKANISSEVIGRMKDKSSAAYVDLEKIFGSISTSSSHKNDSTFIKLRDNFKDIILTADKFDGTKLESHSEIRLKATNQNSLATLLKLIMHIAPGLKNSQTVEDFKNLPLIKNII